MLLGLWLGVAPLLLGLLFELAVGVPARVPLEAAPVLPVFEGAWGAGRVGMQDAIAAYTSPTPPPPEQRGRSASSCSSCGSAAAS